MYVFFMTGLPLSLNQHYGSTPEFTHGEGTCRESVLNAERLLALFQLNVHDAVYIITYRSGSSE